MQENRFGRIASVRVVALSLVVAAVLVACSAGAGAGTNPPGDPGAQQAEPYVAKGRVTDSAGAPLAGIEVFADNTVGYNANVFGVSGADGYYRIELSDIAPSSWRVGAYIEVEYDGVDLRLPLHPDNDDAFAGATGAVRNLTWRMSGEHSTGYYGGEVYVYEGLDAIGSVPDMSRVEVTFVPLAPLLDGSEGETVTAMLDGSRIDDVPLTAYRITARYLPEGGSPVDLVIRRRNVGSYQPSVDADFEDDSWGSVNIELEVILP